MYVCLTQCVYVCNLGRIEMVFRKSKLTLSPCEAAISLVHGNLFFSRGVTTKRSQLLNYRRKSGKQDRFYGAQCVLFK